jgi:hypothetical protein
MPSTPTPGLTAPLLALTLAGAAGLGTTRAHGSEERDLAARLRADVERYDAMAALARRSPSQVRASMLLQTRYMIDARKNDSFFGDSRLDTMGFSIPRAQVRLDANIANEQLHARVSFDFGDASAARGRGAGPSLAEGGTGSPLLRDAYAQYNFSGEQTGYYLKAGQYRSLLLYEESIAPEHQLGVERSITNEFFSPGYTQGVALGFVGPDVAWEVSFNDGIAYLGTPEPANSAFNAPTEGDFAVSSRVDWKLAGDWSRFEDFTSWRGEDVAARVGAGFHWQRQGDSNPNSFVPDFIVGVGTGAEDATVMMWTVDASYESDGWHAFAAYVGHRLEWEIAGTPAVDTLILVQHGVVAQAGITLIDDVEVFARYNAFQIDGDLRSGFGAEEDMYHFLSVGMNYYITPRSHAAKFTFDVTTALNNSDILNAGTTNTILLPDPTVTGLLGDTSEEWLMRAQLQFVF